VFVGVYPTAVPMSYVENGKYTGLSNDILQRVAELQNLKLEYQPMKFDALIPALQAGQIDIGVAGIFITEARKKVVDFSAPYHTEGAVLVAPIGSPIKDVSGLKGKKLAAEQGSVALTVANKYAAEWGVTVRILQDAANMQLAMKSGDVDVMIYDSAIMAYQIRMEGNKPTIKMISDVIGPVGIGFAFQKGSDLVGIVNAGISKMEANGEIAKLKQNYHLN
jgi:ABC-type amino acid transport substrate-binding protein